MLNYKINKLPNGLSLITAPITTTEAVTVLFLVKIGGRYELPEQQGISHFLEHVFFKGTKKRPNAEIIAKELDTLGANYNAFTSYEYTGFFIQSDACDFEKSLELLSDLFLNPTFPAKDIEREKNVVIEDINMHHDVPQEYVWVLNQRQMFPAISLGMDLGGSAETVKKLDRTDVINYFKNGYRADSTCIVICGNPKNHGWHKACEKYIKMQNSREKTVFEEFEIKPIEKLSQQVRKVDQAHFVLSYLTFPKRDPRRYALSLLSTLLAGGMSSRLFTEIRERRGWAYYVKSDVSGYSDIGTFSIYAGVQKDKLNDSLKIIQTQIGDLCQNGPRNSELERAKSNLRGHLALALEDSFEIASYLAEESIYEVKIRQPEEIIDNINKVSKEDIKSLSKDIFNPDKMGLSIVGPKEYKIEI